MDTTIRNGKEKNVLVRLAKTDTHVQLTSKGRQRQQLANTRHHLPVPDTKQRTTESNERNLGH